ncbi:hypothetical protein Cgig2_015298 [Carnegiea gigantea]|uniref:Uncharacterized protein n=1 Tax=Carnegiea gigantea TaxID=171969 RepID=A0A9Q1JQY2_9CARY|nr:hypothetical protein Cgig2_015298 [Carnegiea gigantea]
MTDTILQQVTKLVKRTMEVVNSTRPLATFDYVPTTGYEPSHRYTPTRTLRRSDEVREIVRPKRSRQSWDENHDRSRNKNGPQSSKREPPGEGTLLSTAQQGSIPKPFRVSDGIKVTSNAKEATTHDYDTKTTKHVEALVDRPLLKTRGSIPSQGTQPHTCRTSRRGMLYGDSSHYHWWIYGRHHLVSIEGPNARNAGHRVTVSTMLFDGREDPHFTSPHNDTLVVELKVVNALVRRILIDTGSSVDIITWEC